MKDLMVPVVIILVTVCASVALIDAVCSFHETYFKYSEKIESERWLLAQCKDPEFFANLRQHSELCFLVESNHRVGAFMLALKEAISSLNLEQYLMRALEDAARAASSSARERYGSRLREEMASFSASMKAPTLWLFSMRKQSSECCLRLAKNSGSLHWASSQRSDSIFSLYLK